jgi:hypothetical protein
MARSLFFLIFYDYSPKKKKNPGLSLEWGQNTEKKKKKKKKE